MTDEKTKIVPPAKVHGDSGSSAVVADVEDQEAEDIEETEDAQILIDEEAQPAHSDEAGMRS